MQIFSKILTISLETELLAEILYTGKEHYKIECHLISSQLVKCLQNIVF